LEREDLLKKLWRQTLAGYLPWLPFPFFIGLTTAAAVADLLQKSPW